MTVAATRVTECSVEGCDRTQTANGMCNTHDQRVRRHGTTDLIVMPTQAERIAARLDPTLLTERLTAGLELNPNGCLEWIGSTRGEGYGRIFINGKYVVTHRLAWTLTKGPIPNGLNVLHHCDNPPCAQTDPTEGYPEGHLFLGTIADNNADRSAKGRSYEQGKTHCPAGHPYDETNTYVDPIGNRHCRICKAAAWKRSDAKRRLTDLPTSELADRPPRTRYPDRWTP